MSDLLTVARIAEEELRTPVNLITGSSWTNTLKRLPLSEATYLGLGWPFSEHCGIHLLPAQIAHIQVPSRPRFSGYHMTRRHRRALHRLGLAVVAADGINIAAVGHRILYLTLDWSTALGKDGETFLRQIIRWVMCESVLNAARRWAGRQLAAALREQHEVLREQLRQSEIQLERLMTQITRQAAYVEGLRWTLQNLPQVTFRQLQPSLQLIKQHPLVAGVDLIDCRLFVYTHPIVVRGAQHYCVLGRYCITLHPTAPFEIEYIVNLDLERWQLSAHHPHFDVAPTDGKPGEREFFPCWGTLQDALASSHFATQLAEKVFAILKFLQSVPDDEDAVDVLASLDAFVACDVSLVSQFYDARLYPKSAASAKRFLELVEAEICL